MYTQQQFGKELKEKVLQKEDLIKIGNWAYSVYLKHIQEIDDDTFDNVLLTLNSMEDGPEFAFSYSMLNKIADDLIAGKVVNLNSSEYNESN